VSISILPTLCHFDQEYAVICYQLLRRAWQQ